MHKDKKSEKNFRITLTEEQIAIIKAGLHYYWLDDEYGFALWVTMPGASIDSKDDLYRLKAYKILKKLDELSRVKPEYGLWGDIKRITKLCREDYKKAKKEGAEIEEETKKRKEFNKSIEQSAIAIEKALMD